MISLMGSNPELELYGALEEKFSENGIRIVPVNERAEEFPLVSIPSIMSYPAYSNKGRESGRVVLTIDVWHEDVNALGTVMKMADTVRRLSLSIEETENYQWRVLPHGTSGLHLVDETTGKKLRHYVLDIEHQYIKRGV